MFDDETDDEIRRRICRKIYVEKSVEFLWIRMCPVGFRTIMVDRIVRDIQQYRRRNRR